MMFQYFLWEKKKKTIGVCTFYIYLSSNHKTKAWKHSIHSQYVSNRDLSPVTWLQWLCLEHTHVKRTTRADEWISQVDAQDIPRLNDSILPPN